MNLKSATAAIEAILAAIPDDKLPGFDRVDYEKGMPVVWWNSVGRCLGSATSKGKRDPMVYRRQAVLDVIQLEMTYRADQRLLDNGDDPTGLHFARKAD